MLPNISEVLGLDSAVYAFPFGFLKIGYRGEVLLLLQKVDGSNDDGKKTDFTDHVYREIMEYLKGERTSFDIAYELDGTAFQRKVWEELTKIPYGETRTYKEIAIAIGNPNASRAVGMANNKNPLMMVVPCHRVIGANGKLVGYGGGLAMKRELLAMERRAMKGDHATS